MPSAMPWERNSAMLKIVEQKELSGYAALLESLDAPEGTKLYLTEALDGETVIGHIVYAYEPERVAVYAVDDGGDLYLCDGLVRSVLFKGMLRGLDAAVFHVQDAAMMEKMQKLRFVKNDKNTLDCISEIMDNCKNCGGNATKA